MYGACTVLSSVTSKQTNAYNLLSLSTERVCVNSENYRPHLSVNYKQWPLILDVGSK